ncbi:MAG: US12 family protein [Pirellulaceae bacterium]|nr:US12 family protein [Pirellulaceae bacterium]
MNNPYAVSSDMHVAALASVTERSEFIKRTYLHLGGAIIGFVLLEAVLLNTIGPVLGGLLTNKWAPLLFIGAFMAVGWLARTWAESDTSPQLQYVGLSLYVLAQAVIMSPLLYIAANFVDPQLPMMAGVITGIVFVGLTAFTFISRADFSWMGRILWIAGLASLAAVVCGAVMGFSLGLWFAVGMVVLASAYILYDTSNVLHHYRTTQHVAAALALFSSVAMLFYYIVRILIAMREE